LACKPSPSLQAEPMAMSGVRQRASRIPFFAGVLGPFG
jgi:hypothetical protein